MPFESFFEQEYPSVIRALVLLTANPAEAEDLAEDAFARVWARWDAVGTMASPAGYVYRTALNLHRNRLRRLAVELRHRERPGPASTPPPAPRRATRSDGRSRHCPCPSGRRSCSWSGSA